MNQSVLLDKSDFKASGLTDQLPQNLSDEIDKNKFIDVSYLS